MSKTSRILITAAIALATATGLAMGQDTVVVSEPGTTEIIVPYGQWIETLTAAFRNVIVGIVVAGLGWASASLPSYVAWFFKSRAAEQWIEKAVDRAINAVVGATRGQSMRVDVASEVAAKAAQYMIDNAPRWLVDWLGGYDGIRERALSRVAVQAEQAVAIPNSARPRTVVKRGALDSR